MKKILLSSLALASLVFQGTAQKADSPHNPTTEATAIEVGSVSPFERGATLWNNNYTFNSGPGLVSCEFGGYPAGANNVTTAEDFTVPAGKQWVIDSVIFRIFYAESRANSYRVKIYDSSPTTGRPNQEVASNTFSVTLPNPLSLYNVKVSIPATLNEGHYWISVLGVHDTVTAPLSAATPLTFWNRKDTLHPTMDSAAVVRDSMGLYYGDAPTNWRAIWFTGGNPYNSCIFQIRGTENTPTGVASPLMYDNGSLSVYPNPASSVVNFSSDNEKGRSVNLYDISGKFVRTIPLIGKGTATMETSEMPQGVYFYQLIGKDNEIYDSGKFIISE